MAILTESEVDLETRRGTMRVHLFAPSVPTCQAVIFYSEIFQATGPIRRMAAQLAGEGYLVAVPEVYHEYEPLGTVLAYDTEGTARGNFLKVEKELDSYDEDTEVLVTYLKSVQLGMEKVASFGVCLGGHLAVRAGLNAGVDAVAAFYPTDLHTCTLGRGKKDDTMARIREAACPMLWVFGRQDPHIPLEGRRSIQEKLEACDANYEWHEFNAAHAFLRDEGPRYNPALARVAKELLLRFLAENLR